MTNKTHYDLLDENGIVVLEYYSDDDIYIYDYEEAERLIQKRWNELDEQCQHLRKSIDWFYHEGIEEFQQLEDIQMVLVREIIFLDELKEMI